MTIAQSIDRKDKFRRVDYGFSARLGFLGAAIGQPNLVVSSQDIDHAVTERYVARGRLLRASALRDGVMLVTRRIAKSLTSLLRYTIKQYLHRQDMKALFALNDHMLKDIGLTRGDVESLSNGTISASELNAQRTLIANRGKRSCKVYKFDSVQPTNAKKAISNYELDSADIDIAA